MPGASPGLWDSHTAGQGGPVKTLGPTGNKSYPRQSLKTDTHTPAQSLNAPLGHTGGCCCEHNHPALRSAQPLESSHGISDRAFSSAGSATPWHVDGSHPSITPDNSLLSSSCQSWGGRTQFLDPSLVSNSFMINTIYLQVKATKRSPPRKVIPEVL